MLTLQSIATALGGRVTGKRVFAPTPGHSKRDRGTVVRLSASAPDGLLIHCYNGTWVEIAKVKDTLRDAGLLPEWDGPRRELTEAERAEIRRADAEQERERAEAQAKAAENARERLARARPADPGHPYLARKRIPPERLWQAGEWLLVPMQDAAGAIWNLQRIAPAPGEDGWPKLFLKGGRTSGLFWWAGKPVDRLVIGEGMGTVAAVRRATGLPVLAAMTASNLPAVSVIARAKRPDVSITIAADDDAEGHKRAREAALLVGGGIAYPKGGQA